MEEGMRRNSGDREDGGGEKGRDKGRKEGMMK